MEEIRRAVQLALAEGVGSGDVSTQATVPEALSSKAVMRAREPLVVCGLSLAEATFHETSRAVEIVRGVEDSEHAVAGAALLTIVGPARALLSAERVALNFI